MLNIVPIDVFQHANVLLFFYFFNVEKQPPEVFYQSHEKFRKIRRNTPLPEA